MKTRQDQPGESTVMWLIVLVGALSTISGLLIFAVSVRLAAHWCRIEKVSFRRAMAIALAIFVWGTAFAACLYCLASVDPGTPESGFGMAALYFALLAVYLTGVWFAFKRLLRTKGWRAGGAVLIAVFLSSAGNFLLALPLRWALFEAFVIPTGAMAPTVIGRHKDVTCPQCGYFFQLNASSEIDARTGGPTGHEVEAGTCPMCRFTLDLASNDPQDKRHRSSKGDRIVVSKSSYRHRSPDRWDLAVFKYPADVTTNYIKRICGLPNETLIIREGNLFVKPDGQEKVTIARKPPDTILAMMQPVYDNDYVLRELVQQGLPTRWTSEATKNGGAGWHASDDLKSFSSGGTSPEETWLVYRHRAPSYKQWERLHKGTPLPDGAVRPQLITDFAAYNTEQVRSTRSMRSSLRVPTQSSRMGPPPGPEQLGLHWVGELVLECSVKAEQSSGQFLLALVQGGTVFRCEFDMASGKATLSIGGTPDFRATAGTPFRGPGEHDVRFANVDQRLTLWVDGAPVEFDSPTEFGPLKNSRPQPDDLIPARIGSRGAAVEVSHIRLFRDIYYIAVRHDVNIAPLNDYDAAPGDFPFFFDADDAEEKLVAFLSNPDGWDTFDRRRQVEFHLAQDQFLVLGDNSAQSMDSRLWEARGPQYYVDRDLLIGKVQCIYWPPRRWQTIH